MKPRICVLGSANMDLVATTDQLPAAGETVLGHRFATVPGGKGANQARAAARAGGAVTMIGAVGTDAFGAALRDGLIADGVDTGLLRAVAGPSGVALIATGTGWTYRHRSSPLSTRRPRATPSSVH